MTFFIILLIFVALYLILVVFPSLLYDFVRQFPLLFLLVCAAILVFVIYITIRILTNYIKTKYGRFKDGQYNLSDLLIKGTSEIPRGIDDPASLFNTFISLLAALPIPGIFLQSPITTICHLFSRTYAWIVRILMIASVVFGLCYANYINTNDLINPNDFYLSLHHIIVWLTGSSASFVCFAYLIISRFIRLFNKEELDAANMSCPPLLKKFISTFILLIIVLILYIYRYTWFLCHPISRKEYPFEYQHFHQNENYKAIKNRIYVTRVMKQCKRNNISYTGRDLIQLESLTPDDRSKFLGTQLHKLAVND